MSLVIKDQSGRYWSGISKMSNPPILMMTPDLQEAQLLFAHTKAARIIGESSSPESYSIINVKVKISL